MRDSDTLLAATPVALERQRNLGGYEVLASLKSGGMGDVLLARRIGAHGFEKLIAIKTMRAEFRDRDDARRMFFDEAQLLARLDHPAIAQVYDFGEDGDELFLAMEYVEGVRFSRLADLDAPPAVCVQAMAEVLRGLHAVHELTDLSGAALNVVHRDITPENLMMTFAGRVKVLDFGIALVRGRQAPVTELGTIKGKPPYLSPEQVKSESLDRRTDIFSAAIVLHEMLTGQPLFAGDSVYAIARKIEHDDAPPPSAIVGPLPSGLDEAVLCGLRRDRDQRYATAELFADRLDQVARDIGGERLESYAARELASARDDHRQSLHALLASVESRMAAAPIYGRPSGIMTAPAAVAESAPLPPPTRAAQVVRTADDTDSDQRHGRGVASRARRWSGGLVALAAVAAAVWLVGRGMSAETASPLAAGQDVQQNGLVAGPVLPPVAAASQFAETQADDRVFVLTVDAGSAAPADAADAADKAASRPSDPVADRRDKVRRRRRERPRSPPRDATTEVTPAAEQAPGFGFLTVAAEPYALVRIDGKEVGVTPIFRRRVAAGVHKVTLSSPDTGAVRLERTLQVTVDEEQKVMLR